MAKLLGSMGAAQLASNISSRMNMRETYIRNLADTFSRSPKTILTEELLERKAEYLEMDMIFLLNSDGTTFPSGAAAAHPELDAYRQEHPDIYKNAHIFHSAHSEVFSQLRFSGGTEDRLLSWWVRAPAKCSRRCSRKWILRTRA